MIHKQRGGYEIRLSLCPSLETGLLVHPIANSAECKAYSSSHIYHSKQIVLKQKNGDSDRVVSHGTYPLGLRDAPSPVHSVEGVVVPQVTRQVWSLEVQCPHSFP